MKKILITLFVISMLAVSLGFVIADKPTKFDSNGVEIGWENSASTCTTIQDGILLNSNGEVITPGYDAWGYNYQAHMFNGRYCDYDRVEGGAYCDVDLIMKWNDAWLSNVDCVGDGLLDRHHGFGSYIGSGAWLTNHQSGTNPDGTKWIYFVKMVAKPTADFDCASIDGAEIWGSFCKIQTVSNDPALNEHGVQLLADVPGFGFYRPHIVLVDTVEVYANDSNPTYSNINLESGTQYELEAVGTADAGANIEFDSKYSYRDGCSSEWTDEVCGYEVHGVNLLNLRVNNVFVDWGTYNPEHTYFTTIEGDGNLLGLNIWDTYPLNNVGFITVNIYEHQ